MKVTLTSYSFGQEIRPNSSAAEVETGKWWRQVLTSSTYTSDKTLLSQIKKATLEEGTKKSVHEYLNKFS